MIERLITSLRALATDSDRADAEFADAWYLAGQCTGLELLSDQRELLAVLDDALDTPHRDRRRIRRLADDCLALLSPPAPPPAEDRPPMPAPIEAWLSGPVVGIAPPLWPVAHSLEQARLDAAQAASDLTIEEMWVRPGGAAAAGFHLRHVAGALDRLFTWARGEPLNEDQRAQARVEGAPGVPPASAATLIGGFEQAVARAWAQLRSTEPARLLDARAVGSRKLPSTVQGILFHAAEHSTRHVGQLITTIKVVRGQQRT